MSPTSFQTAPPRGTIYVRIPHLLSGELGISQMDGEGFEPSKASLTDLQSAPFSHLGIHPYLIINILFVESR